MCAVKKACSPTPPLYHLLCEAGVLICNSHGDPLESVSATINRFTTHATT